MIRYPALSRSGSGDPARLDADAAERAATRAKAIAARIAECERRAAAKVAP